nr:hypothetical protein [Candidatus Paceibacterota bacterium]
LDSIEPFVSNSITNPGHPTYSVACFEGNDWSLKPLQKAGDENTAPDLALRVGLAMSGFGARHIYAPSPIRFNGEIVSPDLLTDEIPLWQSIMYRNAKVPADGTLLRSPGSAIVFSAGGCSMIAATRRRAMVGAHAGRDCIIDRVRIKTRGRERSREKESVVNSIVDALAPTWSLRKEIQVGVFYSIKSRDFLHRFVDEDPEHLKYNIPAAEMLRGEYGNAAGPVDHKGIYIDVPGIIKAQFIALGVPEVNINLEHAYLPDSMPHTRNGDNNRRYLAGIVRHF